ncbi:MAG: hypothetical protein A3J69_00860 [Candidatus Levybacteria bacterium RIFCSPHIGHO2_02_FULL_42_12]|nr:MAG: hypothetical protein A2698_01790 [Candidatus Levybacteria bacterium RIFCSPHIGHO2_01_FULL_42_15]OGH31575.1 MAG: hypothetical protein A3J69_00860 [Candidatus Levybacteria bacterium RIFCSPHIGHO2_02_FULL_42_12]OGH42653.1 MAG: hypothetical protein A3B53_02595 [Candidatus Levybacteria bacterium RIFCSPLOWO2_01_FULL_42_15]
MGYTILAVTTIIGVVLLFCWYVYNSLATGKVRIQEAISGIDVQLKRRVDLIPNLIETIKGYAQHEKDVLENLTKARSQLMSAKTPHQKAESDSFLSSTLKTLFAVSENYPVLKASENFIKLQEELSDTENKIAYSRQFYNSNVRDYNTLLANIPSGPIGKAFGFAPLEYFEAEEAAKKPVEVKF